MKFIPATLCFTDRGFRCFINNTFPASRNSLLQSVRPSDIFSAWCSVGSPSVGNCFADKFDYRLIFREYAFPFPARAIYLPRKRKRARAIISNK
ncbi:hypothetical protein SAMN05216316_1465 [Nitrosovibrio sp. Nv6]|nr:hypothetical protein SAMN05216316_1465 [Nitrosovibrio sp. Nv6]